VYVRVRACVCGVCLYDNLGVCVYVVCMYACRRNIYIYVGRYICVCLYVTKSVLTYVCIYACMCARVCMCACVLNVSQSMFMCKYASRVCICVCVCAHEILYLYELTFNYIVFIASNKWNRP